jgi:hypothetical protein
MRRLTVTFAGLVVAVGLVVAGCGGSAGRKSPTGDSVTVRSKGRATLACVSTANAAVKSTEVRVFGLLRTTQPDGKFRVVPESITTAICFDFTRDGRRDVAFAIWTGGSAQNVAWAVLVKTPVGWRVALTRRGYHFGLQRVGRELVMIQPVYKRDDPNCCPTGGFDKYAYGWTGKRFSLLRKWHDKRL